MLKACDGAENEHFSDYQTYSRVLDVSYLFSLTMQSYAFAITCYS